MHSLPCVSVLSTFELRCAAGLVEEALRFWGRPSEDADILPPSLRTLMGDDKDIEILVDHLMCRLLT